MRWRPLVCSIARFCSFGRRPATHGTSRVGGVHRVHEHRDLVLAHGIQGVIVVRDERLLGFLVQLSRDDLGLVIFEPQAMQQRDQTRAALVNKAEFLGDPRADLARRLRKRRRDPSLQGGGLLRAQQARTAAHVEAGQAFKPTLFEQRMPVPDRVVVEQKNLGHFLAAQAVIQQHERVGASRHAAGRDVVAGQRDKRLAILFAEKAATNHDAIRIRATTKCKTFSRLLDESGYSFETDSKISVPAGPSRRRGPYPRRARSPSRDPRRPLPGYAPLATGAPVRRRRRAISGTRVACKISWKVASVVFSVRGFGKRAPRRRMRFARGEA